MTAVVTSPGSPLRMSPANLGSRDGSKLQPPSCSPPSGAAVVVRVVVRVRVLAHGLRHLRLDVVQRAARVGRRDASTAALGEQVEAPVLLGGGWHGGARRSVVDDCRAIRRGAPPPVTAAPVARRCSHRHTRDGGRGGRPVAAIARARAGTAEAARPLAAKRTSSGRYSRGCTCSAGVSRCEGQLVPSGR